MIYYDNIEKETLNNNQFRKIIYTATKQQLVLMSLKSGQEIGSEVHSNTDQFIRIEKGQGKIITDKITKKLYDGIAIIIPAGTRHNIINTGNDDLKLYTIYSPPEHKIITHSNLKYKFTKL